MPLEMVFFYLFLHSIVRISLAFLDKLDCELIDSIKVVGGVGDYIAVDVDGV